MEASPGEYHAANTPSSKSERTRERILDAAASVMSRAGYAGTRLADVARIAEVQAPAIYYYFKSRDELIEEVMWTGANRVRTHVEKVVGALPEETAPMARILAAVDAHLSYVLKVSDYTTASVRNAGQVPEHVRSRPAVEENLYSRYWRKLFEEARLAGALRADVDINVSRLLLLGSMNWAAEWWNPRTRSLADLVKSTQDMVTYGMGAPASHQGTP